VDLLQEDLFSFRWSLCTWQSWSSLPHKSQHPHLGGGKEKKTTITRQPY